LKDLRVEGKAILIFAISKKCGLGVSSCGQGEKAVCCEDGNEPSVFIISGKFLDWLRNAQLYNKYSCTE
jgi:hypothetical protein